MERLSLEPPHNAQIRVDADADDRPRLSWAPAIGRGTRWGGAAFLGFWLCGWFVGEVFALGALGSMILNIVRKGGEPFQWFISAFLLAWLGAWTVGGAAALRTFWIMVRRPRPESLTFDDTYLIHDPGSFLFLLGAPTGKDPNLRRAFHLWRDPPAKEIPWSELGEIRLERVGERQRLTVDWGAERIEIGATLREPEREWLAKVLRAWAGRPDR
jgi:hypothetical protein